MTQRTFLVTGGAGFIGGHVCETLLSQGHRVISLDNYDPFYDISIKRRKMDGLLQTYGEQLIDLHADICDAQAIEQALAPWQTDISSVIHLAAKAGVRPSLLDPQGYLKTNVEGTLNLLEWMRAHTIQKLVFASSSSVYGSRNNAPFKESEDISHPISPYAATKAMAENLLYTYSHLYNIQVTALRFFTVYGAWQRPDLAIHKFSRLMLEEKAIPVFGDGSALRDFSYIDDIVQGIMGAVNYTGKGFDVFNLGESETTSVIDLIRLLETHLNKTARIDWQEAQAGDVPLTCADISKARQALGYNPQTKIEAGIEKFAQWILADFQTTQKNAKQKGLSTADA